jgi:PAS domain S-box-containing protein
MNAAYSDYSGFTLEDALEADLPILSEGHPSDASYRQFCATVAAGSVWQGTLHCPTKDGRLIWERVMVSPAMDAQGGVSHLLCIRENLTAQRELEEKLARAERRLDDELTNAPGDSLGEEALLTLHGAAAWSGEAASLKKGAQATLARIARVTGDIAQRLQAREPRGASEGASVSLTSLIEACARSLRPALPAGRSIAVKNIGSVPRVAGETWPWIHALSLATKHFFSGAESTVAVTLTTRHVKGRKTSAARAGVVQLEIKRRAGRGRRVLAGPDESLFRDSDLAFIAGVVTQAGGRIVSGFENPWIDDLRIELPAVAE